MLISSQELRHYKDDECLEFILVLWRHWFREREIHVMGRWNIEEIVHPSKVTKMQSVNLWQDEMSGVSNYVCESVHTHTIFAFMCTTKQLPKSLSHTHTKSVLWLMLPMHLLPHVPFCFYVSWPHIVSHVRRNIWPYLHITY